MRPVHRSFAVPTLWVTLGVALTASAQTVERSWLAEQEALEARLLAAEVVDTEDVGEGVTEPIKVTLRLDGDVFHAIYKPLKRGRQRGYWESYQAEVAAYELDKMLGLDMVPPTVVRRIGGNLGSLQLWVKGCDSYKRLQATVPRTPGFSQQVSRMKMFDNLIFNDDRNSGNFLLDDSWNIVLIDHSRAFLTRAQILKQTTKRPAQYDRTLVEKMSLLNRADLDAKLAEFLMAGQIENLLKRRDVLLEHMNELVAARGEARVLFN